MGRLDSFWLTLLLVMSTVAPLSADGQDESWTPRLYGASTMKDAQGDPLPQGAISRLGTTRWWTPALMTVASLSPDGRVLAAVGDTPGRGLSYSLHFWNCDTGKLIRRCVNQAKPFTAVCFSPDGSICLTGGRDGALRLWEFTTGREIRCLQAHRDGVACAAFSPNGNAIASGGADRTVRLWDPKTGSLLRELQFHKRTVSSIAFSPDGRTIVSGARTGPSIQWNVVTGRRVAQIATDGCDCLAINSDGTILARGWFTGVAELWDLIKGTRIGTLRHPKGDSVGNVVFSPDGKQVATVGYRGQVRFWNVQSRKMTCQLECNSLVTSMFWSPNNHSFVTVAGGHIILWKLGTGKFLPRFVGHRGQIECLAFSPDGTLLASGSRDTMVHLWSLKSGSLIRAFANRGADVSCVAFSPDGAHIAAGTSAQEVMVWDLLSGKEIHTLVGHEGEIACLCFAPNGKHLYSGSTDGVWSWNVSDGSKGFAVQGKQNELIRSIQVSADGSRLAFTGNSGTAYVAHSRTGKLLGELGAGGSPFFRALAFVQADKLLDVDYDGTLSFWSANDLTLLTRFTLGESKLAPQASLLSPDARFLAICAGTRISLWEVATWTKTREFTTPYMVTQLVFASHGRTLATNGDCGNSILIWDLAGLAPKKALGNGPLKEDTLESLWVDLASHDAAIAYRAIWSLVMSGESSVHWLKKRLPPVPAPDFNRIQRLTNQLDHPKYSRRHAAFLELVKYEEIAATTLQKALGQQPSAEARKRIGDLLRKLESFSSGRLQQTRAIAVLEYMRTCEATCLLGRLSKGTPEALLTQESGKALARLPLSLRESLAKREKCVENHGDRKSK